MRGFQSRDPEGVRFAAAALLDSRWTGIRVLGLRFSAHDRNPLSRIPAARYTLARDPEGVRFAAAPPLTSTIVHIAA